MDASRDEEQQECHQRPLDRRILCHIAREDIEEEFGIVTVAGQVNTMPKPCVSD